MKIGLECRDRGVPIIDVNIESTPFSDMAARAGLLVRETATAALPRISSLLAAGIQP